MRNFSKILWGVVLICIGLIMAINSCGLVKIDIFFDGWWTLFIIIPSFISLFDGDDVSGSLIGLFIGLALLGACQDWISFSLIRRLIVPFIIVIIGLSILKAGLFGKKVKEKVIIKDDEHLESIAVVMGEETKVIKNDFKGAEVDAVFASCTIDLKDAKITEDVSIKVSSVFAKTDIILPANVTLKLSSTRVFGSVSNVMKESTAKKAPVVYVEATSVFGGINIR